MVSWYSWLVLALMFLLTVPVSSWVVQKVKRCAWPDPWKVVLAWVVSAVFVGAEYLVAGGLIQVDAWLALGPGELFGLASGVFAAISVYHKKVFGPKEL